MEISRSEPGKKRLLRWALIAGGYVFSPAAGMLSAWAMYANMPQQVLQQSGGMVAGGQMMVFLAVGGGCALFPTYFLLRELSGAAWLWTGVAVCGAAASSVFLLAEAAIIAAYAAGGYSYHYPDPAFFNLDFLAWIFYRAPHKSVFFLAPPLFAVQACFWLAAPGGIPRRVLGWSSLAALSGACLCALHILLLFMDKAVHP